MRRIVAISLVATWALFLSADRAPAAPGVQFGIQDDAWLEFGPGTLNERVATLRRLGLDAVRITLPWHRIEPTSGQYRWARSDRLLTALRRGGLAPVVTIWGTPDWANGRSGTNVAPRSAQDLRAFATAAAGRYPFVRHWVLWNEPNKPLWLKPASARTYVTQILNPGYAGIKSVLPAARVAGGVTAPRGGAGGMSPVDFIRGMKAAGARLDAYAHHPYPIYAGDTPFVGGCACKVITMATLERLEAEVGRAFPRARIWLTEYGYQTNPPDRFGVSLAEQARFVGEAARRVYQAPKVDLLIHYLYRDEPDLARWQSGLETVRGTAKPAMAATALPLVQLSRKGLQTAVWGQVRPGTGVKRYVLQRLSGRTWTTVGGVSTTNARGYFRRTVLAPKGTALRIWYPAQRLASPSLVVR